LIDNSRVKEMVSYGLLSQSRSKKLWLFRGT